MQINFEGQNLYTIFAPRKFLRRNVDNNPGRVNMEFAKYMYLFKYEKT